MSLHAGPLPPASEFAAYERTLPSSAERILRMAERQQEHRLAYEKAELYGFILERTLSQVFAFIFAVLALALAYECAREGWMALAIAIVSTTIGGVVGAFLIKRFIGDKEP